MRRYGALFVGLAAMREVRADGVDDRGDLLLGEPGEDRQREAFGRDGLRDGERARPVPEPRVGRREVHRPWVVPSRTDATVDEEGGEPFRLLRADDVEMPHGLGARSDLRQAEGADPREAPL